VHGASSLAGDEIFVMRRSRNFDPEKRSCAIIFCWSLGALRARSLRDRFEIFRHFVIAPVASLARSNVDRDAAVQGSNLNATAVPAEILGQLAVVGIDAGSANRNVFYLLRRRHRLDYAMKAALSRQ